jgi:outer membrane lipoprotein-sorting protein
MNRMNVFKAVPLLFLLVNPSLAQKQAAVPSALKMMQNAEKGFEGIRDYIATIEAQVDMERVRIPKVTATMYFKKPDKVHFSSTSFAMLPREGIVLNPTVLLERYNAKTLGDEDVDGVKAYKLELSAREVKIRPAQLYLWIDPTTWTIVRVETIPYQGRILRLAFTYAAQSGGFVLTQTMKATFSVAARDSSVGRLDLDPQAPPQFDEMPRPSRSGSIVVKYLDYKINTGLSDDIFEKREEVPKAK